MDNRYTHEDCPLRGGDDCRLLNMPGCNECPVNKLPREEKVKAGRELRDTAILMPIELVRCAAESSHCLLCNDDVKRKRTCYAVADLGHKHPNPDNSSGISKGGLLVPVQIASCSQCKRNFTLASYLPDALALLITGIALVLLSIRSIREPLMAVLTALPLIVFIIACILAVTVRYTLRRCLVKKLGKSTKFKISDIGIISRMYGNGWFELYGSNRVISKVYFNDAPLSKGPYTAYIRESNDGPADIKLNQSIEE